MKEQDLLHAILEIEPSLIADAAPAASMKTPPRRILLSRRILIAACVCIALGAVLFACEAHTYGKALSFFKEYDLATEGLNLFEIKAVYLDICGNSFHYPKTGEVLHYSICRQVNGIELTGESAEADSELYKKLWEHFCELRQPQPTYGEDTTYDPDRNGSIFCKKLQGKVVWRAFFPEIQRMTLQWKKTSTGVLVYGNEPVHDSGSPCHYHFYALSENGKTVWEQELILPGGCYVNSVTESADGSISVFSRIRTSPDQKEYTVTLDRYALSDGQHTRTVLSSDLKADDQIHSAVKLGEDYLLCVGESDLYRVRPDGSVSLQSIQIENQQICIGSIVEFSDKVYISATLYPQTDGRPYDLCDRIIAQFGGEKELEGEALVSFIREQYTALLLVVDRDSGSLQTFYTVKGCRSGGLTAGDALVWEVRDLYSASYHPYAGINPFTHAKIDCYWFDPAGKLLFIEHTGKETSF